MTVVTVARKVQYYLKQFAGQVSLQLEHFFFFCHMAILLSIVVICFIYTNHQDILHVLSSAYTKKKKKKLLCSSNKVVKPNIKNQIVFTQSGCYMMVEEKLSKGHW